MLPSNKTMGNTFERRFCDLLFQHGFWAHNMAQTAAGQPADVIAVKGQYHTLIDCKVVTGQGFRFSRVEDNQRTAMDSFRERGKEPCWFALLLPGGDIQMLSYETVKRMETMEDMHSLTIYQMPRYAYPFERWLKIVNLEAKA